MPPDVGGARCPERLGHLRLGLARRAVLLRKEDAGLLPYDLLGAVPEDPLGAGVPREHPPVGVDHEDGEGLDALDEQAVEVGAERHRRSGEQVWR